MFSLSRTSCACAECVACCKRQPGPLVTGDMERIADYLGVPLDHAKLLFKASRGALILYKGKVVRVPTITPKQHPDGSCIFLDEHDRCSIHPVSPFGCAYFDPHMDKAEGNRRARLAIMDQSKPEYQALREELK